MSFAAFGTHAVMSLILYRYDFERLYIVYLAYAVIACLDYFSAAVAFGLRL